MWYLMVRSVFQAESALQLLVLLLLAVASCGVAVAEGNTSAEAEVSAYRLSVGDRIKVNVLGQADLSV